LNARCRVPARSSLLGRFTPAVLGRIGHKRTVDLTGGMRAFTTFLTVLLCGAAAVAADYPRASFTGVGSVRIGMTADELGNALGHTVAPEAADDARCFYAPGDGSSSFSAMVQDGRVVRIDVHSPSIPTLRGVRVGDKVDVVRKLYGAALKEEPHFYAGLPDLYLTYFSSDRRFALRFETHEGVVANYYLGYAEPTQYVEGCL
jgi:hypothetical protein